MAGYKKLEPFRDTYILYFTFLGMGQANISTRWPGLPKNFLVWVGINSVPLSWTRFQVEFLTLPIPRDTMSICYSVVLSILLSKGA